jgi:hypothetical protein
LPGIAARRMRRSSDAEAERVLGASAHFSEA